MFRCEADKDFVVIARARSSKKIPCKSKCLCRALPVLLSHLENLWRIRISDEHVVHLASIAKVGSKERVLQTYADGVQRDRVAIVPVQRSFLQSEAPILVGGDNLSDPRLRQPHLGAEQAIVRLPKPSANFPAHVHLYQRKLLRILTIHLVEVGG